MTIKIKGSVGVTYVHTGNGGNFEYTLDELGITKEEWKSLDDKQRQDFLDGILNDEIGEKLDAGIWVEGDDEDE